MHWQLHCDSLLPVLGVATAPLQSWPGTLSPLVLEFPQRYCIDLPALPPAQQERARERLAHTPLLLGDGLPVSVCAECYLAAALDGAASDEQFLRRGAAAYEALLVQQRGGQRLDPDQVQRMLREQRTLQLWLTQPAHEQLQALLMHGIELIEEVRRAQDPARLTS